MMVGVCVCGWVGVWLCVRHNGFAAYCTSFLHLKLFLGVAKWKKLLQGKRTMKNKHDEASNSFTRAGALNVVMTFRVRCSCSYLMIEETHHHN